ncbi:hypothetical protein QTP88_000608 [Uroleucon formosanum]
MKLLLPNLKGQTFVIAFRFHQIHFLRWFLEWLCLLKNAINGNRPIYQYLATGLAFRQIAISFKISKSAVSSIVIEVCKRTFLFCTSDIRSSILTIQQS